MFWNSLFIEGSYTRTVDGKEVEVSKNRLQNKIMEATNYEGSPIANFVEGLDNLGDTVTAEPKKETKAKKEAPKESTESDEDLMNDLGL
jgi:hypothetical protein